MNDVSHRTTLLARRLGIDTYQEPVVYMRRDCDVCRSEGFEAQSRVRVTFGEKSIFATLNVVERTLLRANEAGLSEAAWMLLQVSDGESLSFSHPKPLASLGCVRKKVFGQKLDDAQIKSVIDDIVARRYSDVQLASFITACAARPLNTHETTALTRAMVAAGETLDWGKTPIMDKHCVGGVPGNRTTLIVVPIVTACGLTMPKTSSRAITSPAGSADAMETLAPVDLSIGDMRRVVENVGGCIVWGGSVRLSPADDILIRVERALELDTEGQLIASVLSKKVAAGSTHVVLDIPVGATAKIRSDAAAESLSERLREIGARVGLEVSTVVTDGSQPVGRGIGPALEAHDVLLVLRNEPDAPADLKEKSLVLAGRVLDLSGRFPAESGYSLAETTLSSGRAWIQFQRICESQGGMRVPPISRHTRPVLAANTGTVTCIDNRLISRAAKLAGAPEDAVAGVALHVSLDAKVEAKQPLFTLHGGSVGELNYAWEFVRVNPQIIQVSSGE